jgi:hypothetical protein
MIVQPLEGLYEKVLEFLPNFLASLLLLMVGIVVGKALRMIVFRLLKAVHLDKHFERFGMDEVLGKGGIKEPLSVLLSRIVGWIAVFIFVVLALKALNIPSVERLLVGFVLYLPNVFVAALILFFGYFLSNFLGRAALITSVNAGIRLSGLIGQFTRLAVFLLSITMALEQLGIGSNTIVIAFAITFGGVVLALSIAFGLGGRDIAKDYLEKKIRGGEEKKDEISHM